MANLGSTDTPIAGESFGLPSGWSITENAAGEVVIEDSGANVVFRRDETAGEWVTDSIDAESVSVDIAHITQVAGRLVNGSASSEQDVESNTVTKVDWNSQAFEDSDIVNVDATNNEIEILEAGDYVITSRVVTRQGFGDGTQIRLYVYVNGSTVATDLHIGANSSQGHYITEYIRDMDTNDTIDIRIQQDSGETQTLRQEAFGTVWRFDVRRVA